MVMLNLQNTFNTITNAILLAKFRVLDFNNSALQWVLSYMEGRVDVNGTISNPLPLSCGIPQGSILEPLFFLLYINDMESETAFALETASSTFMQMIQPSWSHIKF